MAIYKRGRIWWVDVKRRGGPRIRSSTGSTSKTTAELIEAALVRSLGAESPDEELRRKLHGLVDLALGDPPKPALEVGVPLASVFDDTIRVETDFTRPTSRHTRSCRAAAIRRLMEWLAQTAPHVTTVGQVDRRTAQAFSSHLAREKIAPKTRANIVGHLSSAWNSLKRLYDGIENPWPLAAPSNVESRRGSAFTDDQVRRVLCAADEMSAEWALASRISLATGLREGDVRRLRGADVRGGVVRLAPSKTRRHGILVAIPLPASLAASLPEVADGAPLMPQLASSPEHAARADGVRFRDILERAGVPTCKFTFHSFRHTFRTRLSRAGVADDIAMRLGGWTERATSLHYDHDGRRQDVAEAVEAAWTVDAPEGASSGHSTGVGGMASTQRVASR